MLDSEGNSGSRVAPLLGGGVLALAVLERVVLLLWVWLNRVSLAALRAS